MKRKLSGFFIFLILWKGLSVCFAQVDTSKRELVQLGYNQPLKGHGPLSAYAFYYLNLPGFLKSNQTLRLALAPVYVDSEIGFTNVLNKKFDLGIGLAGGGFADSYDEVRRGKHWENESFVGHGFTTSANLYKCFNPNQRIPLNGVLKIEIHYADYHKGKKTDDNFALPSDTTNIIFRSGLRFGGSEPKIHNDFALELSGWYEGQIRTRPGAYGYESDRKIENHSHLFWTRALMAYTLSEKKHTLNLSAIVGTSYQTDRFSAYRLGGVLPLAAEFPLALPGYYFQEISARRFVIIGSNYTMPLDRSKRWSMNMVVATAGVVYLKGLEQPGHWHTGVGSGIGYRSTSDAWQIVIGYAYGIDALRENQRGAHSLGFLLQFDLERADMPLVEPGDQPTRSRGLQRILDLPGEFYKFLKE